VGRYGIPPSQSLSHDHTVYERRKERLGNVPFCTLKLKCTKFDFPAGGAYSASPEPLDGFKGATSKGMEGYGRKGGDSGKGGEGRERDGKERKGKGGDHTASISKPL